MKVLSKTTGRASKYATETGGVGVTGLEIAGLASVVSEATGIASGLAGTGAPTWGSAGRRRSTGPGALPVPAPARPPGRATALQPTAPASGAAAPPSAVGAATVLDVAYGPLLGPTLRSEAGSSVRARAHTTDSPAMSDASTPAHLLMVEMEAVDPAPSSMHSTCSRSNVPSMPSHSSCAQEMSSDRAQVSCGDTMPLRLLSPTREQCCLTSHCTLRCNLSLDAWVTALPLQLCD